MTVTIRLCWVSSFMITFTKTIARHNSDKYAVPYQCKPEQMKSSHILFCFVRFFNRKKHSYTISFKNILKRAKHTQIDLKYRINNEMFLFWKVHIKHDKTLKRRWRNKIYIYWLQQYGHIHTHEIVQFQQSFTESHYCY